MNANDLQGCFSLSNSITVNRVTEGDLCISSTIEVNPQSIQLNFSPNPARDYLDINLNFDERPNQLQVEIRSVTGKLLLTKELAEQVTLNERLELIDMPQGIYLLSIRTDQTITTRKFIKK